MSIKYHIKTFGCQMNKLDSALVDSAFAGKGFINTDSVKESDVVLINTCSVRQHAEQRVISHLGHLQHLKKSKPHLVVVIFGCMAQRLGSQLLEHPAVDIVVGPAQIPQISNLVISALQKHNKAVVVTAKIRSPIEENVNLELEDFELFNDSDDKQIPAQAFVRTMRGCDKFCTYCIVPFVRGPEESRAPKAIIEQVKRLAGQGIKQITFIGQTINRYKWQNGERTYRLVDLLEMASDVQGIEWIKFITSHPADFDVNIFYAMRDIDKVCRYLHIPAQSGSDKMLKAMNRGYKIAEYTELLEKAKSIVPDIAIASDFIVGFPNETDQDFQATKKLVEDTRFKNSFIFKYSPRPGTIADKNLQDNISEEVKKQRNVELLEAQNKICQEDNQLFVGKTVKVLVEGLSKKAHLNQTESQNLPQLIGRTATEHIVVFNGPPSLTGYFTNVYIEKAASLTLFGKLL